MNLKAIRNMAILGAIMVALDQSFLANIIFMITNPLLAWHNYTIKEMEQAQLYALFFVIAVFGVSVQLSI